VPPLVELTKLAEESCPNFGRRQRTNVVFPKPPVPSFCKLIIEIIANGSRDDVRSECQPPESTQISSNPQRSVGSDEYLLQIREAKGLDEHQRINALEFRMSRQYRLTVIALECREEHSILPVVLENMLNTLIAETALAVVKQHGFRFVCL
jgi:hypothetical protein